MANTQDLLDLIASKLGGTQPDATHNPHFYSGYIVGDSTGLSGLHGAYSVAPETVQEPPFAIVLPGAFSVNPDRAKDLLMQGEEYNIDDLKLLLLIRRNDAKTQYAVLNPFRDSVPAVFRGATQLGNPSLIAGQSILQVWVASGRPGVFEWGGTTMIGWEFTLRVARMMAVTYTP